MRTRLSDAKATSSGIARVLNLSPTDSRFTDYLNEATRRLVQTGELFYGLFARYQFCVTAGCITWPRHIATIEAAAVNDSPITVRNGWFEFIENGIGIQTDGCCTDLTSCHSFCPGQQALDRGDVCAFADIIGTDKKIKVYADVAESASAVITLQGFDENGNWIRTQVSGNWIDGEQVSISTTPQTSTKYFSSLVAVQKPITNGSVRLYEYDTTLATQRAMAVYEPSETNPSYRRTMVTAICPDCEGTTTSVTVMAKLEFIPVSADADWLLIGNLPALKDMCQSIRKAENNLFEEAAAWELRAVSTLRREVAHYRGHGVVNPIRLVPRQLGGPAVVNLI